MAPDVARIGWRWDPGKRVKACIQQLRVMPDILDCRFKFGIRHHATLHDMT